MLFRTTKRMVRAVPSLSVISTDVFPISKRKKLHQALSKIVAAIFFMKIDKSIRFIKYAYFSFLCSVFLDKWRKVTTFWIEWFFFPLEIDDITIPPPPVATLSHDVPDKRLIITELRIKNFKSYANEVVLGPFDKVCMRIWCKMNISQEIYF